MNPVVEKGSWLCSSCGKENYSLVDYYHHPPMVVPGKNCFRVKTIDSQVLNFCSEACYRNFRSNVKEPEKMTV
jgi:ribosomal protein L24E